MEEKRVVTADRKDVSLMSFNELIKDPRTKKRFHDVLGSKADLRMAELQGLWNSTPALQKCIPTSIIQCAMQAAALDLSVDKNIGYAAIVPYNSREKMPKTHPDGSPVYDDAGRIVYEEQWVSKAQFQIQWKGWGALARRSRQYRYLNADMVFDDEKVERNYITGEMTIVPNPNGKRAQFDRDDLSFESLVKQGVVGYFCYLETTYGYSHTEYWALKDIYAHAKRYSKSFQDYLNPPKDYKTGKPRTIKAENVLWAYNFDAMARKTLMKSTISKYGDIDTSMAAAVEADQKVFGSDEDEGRYLDNPATEAEYEERQEETPKQEPKRRNPTTDEVLKKVSPADIPHEGIEVPDGPAPNPDAEPKWNPETGDFEY